MDHAFTTVIGIIVLVLLLFFAIWSYGKFQEQKEDNEAQTTVNEFTSSIANTGSLTMEEYYQFLDKLSVMGTVVQIEIECITPNDVLN